MKDPYILLGHYAIDPRLFSSAETKKERQTESEEEKEYKAWRSIGVPPHGIKRMFEMLEGGKNRSSSPHLKKVHGHKVRS